VKVASALREAGERLAPATDTARLDAELLMAHALQVTRSDLLLGRMGDEAPAAFAQLVERRMAREPVAYITGEAAFWGRPFQVTRDVLIPRADSETLIEAALDLCPKPARVLDLGTGSGALLLTVVAETGAEGVGVDCSAAALSVARRNAARLGIECRVSWRLADWRDPAWADELGRFDLVLANPPYIEEGANLAPDVAEYEPHGALFAGEGGLAHYRILVPQLAQLLEGGGTGLFEVGAGQALDVSEIAEHAGYAAGIRRDLGGRGRVVVLTPGDPVPGGKAGELLAGAWQSPGKGLHRSQTRRTGR
jgi:release factor glutamine methyltransferase